MITLWICISIIQFIIAGAGMFGFSSDYHRAKRKGMPVEEHSKGTRVFTILFFASPLSFLTLPLVLIFLILLATKRGIQFVVPAFKGV